MALVQSDIVLADGAIYQVESGETVNNTTVNSGGSMLVLSGGTATDTTVNSYGELYISSGGMANNTTVNNTSRGGILVYGGGTVNSTTINSGGRLFIYNDGTANSAVINSGGWIFIYYGKATDVMENGGFVSTTNGVSITFVPNTIEELLLENTSATIHSGTTANNVTVNTCGCLNIFSGGTATKVLENGGYVSVADGADVTFVPNAINDLLLEEAFATIHSGTTANNTTINSSGFLSVYRGGTANSAAVNSSGTLLVYSGGTAINATVNPRGYMAISSGGTANNTTVNSSGDFRIYGTADSTTVNLGGSLNISSGGTANNTTVNSGVLYIQGAANNITTVNNTEIRVYSGGTANNTTVNSGGGMFISSGGTANNTTVNSGVLYIRGAANNITTVNNTKILVYSGGTANNTTVNSGGSMFISSGGTATGRLTLANGAVVSATSDAIIDFDLTRAEAGADALVNNLSILQGTPLYTLTVDGDQANGSYSLAGGAAGFADTISVANTAGESLGSLAVGETLKVGKADYTLTRTESVLSVTVGGMTVPETAPPDNLVGTAEKVAWEETEAEKYVVEYSTDNFEHVISVVTNGNTVDTPNLPAGTYQWRVKADDNSDWAVGEAIAVAPEADAAPRVVRSNEDGSDDLFFASPNGTWNGGFKAKHVGSVNDWSGTGEQILLNGQGRIRNLFFGSADPNVLCLTDGDNGDAIFVDDIYTDLPEEIAKNTARLFKIHEIRAGAGDDIIDMTSQRFEYIGEGLTIRGGDGDDTIWANKGDNRLFGDDGNDRIVGASGNDVIVGGIGNDRMHGGGGEDIFTFCDNWGIDTVEQLSGGKVTLWFASGDEANWNAETLTYTDGENSVKVSGVAADRVTLKFGDDGSAQFASLANMGVFFDATSERIFEESGKGILASL